MKRTRWTMRLVGSALLAAGMQLCQSGCKQQLFMEPADYHNAMKNGIEAKLEASPHEPILPELKTPTAAPATVVDPSRPARPMTLKECIAIGLERGNVGGPGTNPGFLNEQLPSFTGRGTTGTDAIQAFALQPSIAAAEIERSLSKFDARWISSMTWNSVDQPTLSLQQSFSNGDSATLNQTLAKPLPTGGVAGITFSTQYLKLANPPTNPDFIALTTSYTPRLQFVFEQPLLQSFGVEINQLSANHPGSLLIPGFRTSGQGTEGILITRLRADQQRAEFDRQVNDMLLNIETAYWNLYAAYYNLAAQEKGTKQALFTYNFFKGRAGQVSKQSIEFQNEQQYWSFRNGVITARAQILEAERNLRGLLGMSSDDGDRIVPVDEPFIAPVEPNWAEIVNEVYQNQPSLIIARQEVKAQQLNLLNQKNLRRPDLRLLTSYDIAGLGPRLDGATIEDNAFRSLASNQFNSWQVGLRLEMPIGFRDANASVRQAQLSLSTSYLQLRDAERKAKETAVFQYQRVKTSYEQIKVLRAQRIALEKQIALDNQLLPIDRGGDQVVALLQAQQFLANAIAQEYRAIADYNSAIAGLERIKGTIQRYNNVTVAEGPLPAFVQKKAADHFAAREAAIKLREHVSESGVMPPLSEYQPMPIDLPLDPMMSLPLPTQLPSYPGTTPSTMPLTPMAPMQLPPPPAPPRPMSSGTGQVNQPLPQLVPGDGPSAIFTPNGTLDLPTRSRSGLVPAVPTSLPK